MGVRPYHLSISSCYYRNVLQCTSGNSVIATAEKARVPWLGRDRDKRRRLQKSSQLVEVKQMMGKGGKRMKAVLMVGRKRVEEGGESGGKGTHDGKTPHQRLERKDRWFLPGLFLESRLAKRMALLLGCSARVGNSLGP